jgi:hypothetical protein
MSPPSAAADDGGHSTEGSAAGKSKAEKERTTKMPLADPARGKKAEKVAALAEASRPGKAKKKRIRRVKDDEMKILEVLAAHVKSEGALPKMTSFLLAAVGKRLCTKNCTNSNMDEIVQQLKKQYKKAVRQGSVPSKEDDLQIYKLSEAVWIKKEKKPVAANGIVEVTTTDTTPPSKKKKRTSETDELDKDARRKRARTDERKNKEGETHDDETERDAKVEVTRRGFDELQGLYSNLAVCVEQLEVQNPSRETLKRGFELIGDEKAESLEQKVTKQRVSEVKSQLRRADVKKDVLNTLSSLVCHSFLLES